MFNRAQHILSRSGVYSPYGQDDMAAFEKLNGSVLRLTGIPQANSAKLPGEQPGKTKARRIRVRGGGLKNR